MAWNLKIKFVRTYPTYICCKQVTRIPNFLTLSNISDLLKG